MPVSNSLPKSSVALVLVDVINHFEFPDGTRTLKNSLPLAPRLVRLKARAAKAGIPVIYVNDNFGQWRSDSSKLLEYCLRPEAKGRDFVEAIRPDPNDYFVLKPMHSAFYQTPLDLLLQYLGASSIILCGIATNSCILCTAHDAQMRNIGIYVASDCCAARSKREHQQALVHVKEMASAQVLPSSRLPLESLRKGKT
jgi:nicotinamidase-related amidase